jgi:hypothetical protein
MLATAATLLFGLSTSVMGYGYVLLSTVSEEKFKSAEEEASQISNT